LNFLITIAEKNKRSVTTKRKNARELKKIMLILMNFKMVAKKYINQKKMSQNLWLSKKILTV
jgi:hypothetical protein